MRILHIVTMVTPDGSLGGPLRVAVNLMHEQKANGHDVKMLSIVDGFGDSNPSNYQGIPLTSFKALRVLPGAGFAGVTSPFLFVWLITNRHKYDVVHIHMCRDLVTLPSALVNIFLQKKYIVQTHGTIDYSDKKMAKILDTVATRRALRSASKILALTTKEVKDLRIVDNKLNLTQFHILRNGVPASQLRKDYTSSDEIIDVLFLARLHERKRPVEFVKSALEILKVAPNTKFSLVGPDEGELDQITALISSSQHQDQIVVEGSLSADKTAERMANASIYVLPAYSEPFGMTIVEASSVAIPVVVMEDCGLAEDVLKFETGVVATYKENSLTQAIMELVKSAGLRQRLGLNGLEYVNNYCSIQTINKELENIYSEVNK